MGLSERKVIEEARTNALIRTCHKCKVRILKEDGCNKIICTTCASGKLVSHVDMLARLIAIK